MPLHANDTRKARPDLVGLRPGAADLLLAATLSLAPRKRSSPWADTFDHDDWVRFVERARVHQVAPQVYRRIVASPVLRRLPAELAAELRNDYQSTARQTASQMQQAADIVRALEDAGIPVIALKGAHLLPEVYGDPGLRSMRDLDLMVPVPFVDVAERTLSAMGYGPEDRAPFEYVSRWNNHLPPFEKAGAVSVDVHWTIEHPHAPVRIDVEGLWARAGSMRLGHGRVKVLSRPDALLHLCLHASIHHGFDIALKHVVDIAASIRRWRRRFEWDTFADRANQWNAGRLVFTTLHLAADLVGAAVPAGAFRALEHHPIDRELSPIIQAHILRRPPVDPPDRSHTRRLITRWLQAVTGMETLFPPDFDPEGRLA